MDVQLFFALWISEVLVAILLSLGKHGETQAVIVTSTIAAMAVQAIFVVGWLVGVTRDIFHPAWVIGTQVTVLASFYALKWAVKRYA